MAILLPMPKLSDTMSEGTIAKWLKNVGDKVNEGDTLLEVETDKATMEYHAPDDGYLLQILAKDEPVRVGAPIAVFGAKGEEFDLKTLLGETKHAPQVNQQSEDQATTSQTAVHGTVEATNEQTGKRVRSSPLARKLAAASGLALHTLRGTGPRGRVVARDVMDVSPKQNENIPPGSGGGAGGVATEGGEAQRTKPNLLVQEGVQGEFHAASRVKTSTLRRTLAKRLTAAKNEAPHFYLQRSVDVRQLLAVRAKLNQIKDHEQSINLNALISYICVRSLLQHPEVNSSWGDGKEIIQHNSVHLATAVAMPNGLVTPVVRDSDTLSLVEFNNRLNTAITAARAGKLTNEDLLGGTFTISNLGMFGIERFTAIINPPQAAILAVGAVHDQLALEDGHISVRKEMILTLSCDHRVVDGAIGARFLATLAENLALPFFI